MTWSIREASENGVRAPQYANTGLFTIAFHHGGFFDWGDKVSYIGGIMSYVDYCHQSDMSYLTLVAIASKFSKREVKKLFYKSCDGSFETDLVKILYDRDCAGIESFVDNDRVVDVYCEYFEEGLSSSSDDCGDLNVECGRDSDLERFSGSDEEIGRNDESLFDISIESNNSKQNKGKAPAEDVLLDVDVDVLNIGYVSSDGFDSHCDSDDELQEATKYTKFGNSDLGDVKFEVGMTFSCGDVFKLAVKEYALQNGRNVKFKKNAKKKMILWCPNDGCKWYMYCSKNRDDETVQIKSYKDIHSCNRTMLNRSAKPRFIAGKFMEMIRENPTWEIKAFEAYAARKLQCTIELPRAYRSFKYAKSQIEGTSADQYLALGDYMEEIKRSNPGSTVVLKSKKNTGPNGESTFKGIYICWAALKRGFLEGCRPVIGLDGCHLTGPHKGVLLAAVSIDANNCMYPFAYAVVASENYSTWRWFIKLLSRDVDIVKPEEYTVISDKQKGLIKAVEELLPGIEHRFCVRHLYQNFKQLHKGQLLKDLLWKTARASTKVYFEKALEEMKQVDEEAFKWLESKPGENWSRSHFATYSKCDMLLNNLCESFNAAIKNPRGNPILTMLEEIRIYLMGLVMKKRETMRKLSVPICPKINAKLEILKANCHEWKCVWNGIDGFEISGISGNRYGCSIKDHCCGCNRWQLSGIPCVHGVTAIKYMRRNFIDYVHQCYSKDTYMRTYSNVLQPLNGREMWPKSNLPPLLPPHVEVTKGKPKKARRKGEDEKDEGINQKRVSRKGVVIKCGKCGIEGHNQRSCGKPKKKQYIRKKPQPATTLVDSDMESDDLPETSIAGEERVQRVNVVQKETVVEMDREETINVGQRENVIEEVSVVENETIEPEEVVQEEHVVEKERVVEPAESTKDWMDGLFDASLDAMEGDEFWDKVENSVRESVAANSSQRSVKPSESAHGGVETNPCVDVPKLKEKRKNTGPMKSVRKSSRIMNSPRKGPIEVDHVDLTQEQQGPSTQESGTLHAGIMKAKPPKKFQRGHIFKDGKRYKTYEALQADLAFKKKLKDAEIAKKKDAEL